HRGCRRQNRPRRVRPLGRAGAEEDSAHQYVAARHPEVTAPVAPVGEIGFFRLAAIFGGQRRFGSRRPRADRLVSATGVITALTPTTARGPSGSAAACRP